MGKCSTSLEKTNTNENRKLKNIVDKEPLPEVFRAGDPIFREREAYIPRVSINEKLTKQLLMAKGCPGVVMTGPRRVGKTTVLRNLQAYMPANTKVLDMSMEQPHLNSSERSFYQHIVQRLRDKEAASKIETWSDFEDSLKDINQSLQKDDEKRIIAIDEYEGLDNRIQDSLFDIQILKSIRGSIQDHRQLIWLFAGNRSFEELKSPWAKYLISIRSISVGMFTVDETKMLLSDPMRYAQSEPDTNRARIPNETWGIKGAEEIHRIAGGWPHLVQLLAETTLSVLSDVNAKRLDDKLFEMMLCEAEEKAQQTLRQLIEGETETKELEFEWLLQFKNKDEVEPPQDHKLRRSLKRRQLITEIDENRWGMRVPLMHRWIRNY